MTPDEILDAIMDALKPIPGEPNGEFWARSRALQVIVDKIGDIDKAVEEAREEWVEASLMGDG